MIDVDRLRVLIEYNPKTGLFHWVNPTSPRVKVGSAIGSSTSNGYLSVRLDGKSYLLHRIAWLHFYGVEPDGFIDHINGDRVDNRIKNLRVVSKTQNNRNTSTRSHNGTGVKGVGIHKQTGRYRARIRVDGKEIHLGLFDDIESASKAYRDASEKYHGEYGCACR